MARERGRRKDEGHLGRLPDTEIPRAQGERALSCKEVSWIIHLKQILLTTELRVAGAQGDRRMFHPRALPDEPQSHLCV
jgi:hypothetical protein